MSRNVAQKLILLALEEGDGASRSSSCQVVLRVLLIILIVALVVGRVIVLLQHGNDRFLHSWEGLPGMLHFGAEKRKINMNLEVFLC